MLGRATELAAAAADLVLPSACAGCGAERVPLRFGACWDCVAVLEALQAFPASPVPSPSGMPPCMAMGPYADVLRGVLLAYKERGRHGLAKPLGTLLAAAVTQVALQHGASPKDGVCGGVPLLVLPVPSTASAARERHGDHLARLAAHAVRRLRAAGCQAQVVRPLRALPRADSVSLDAAGRAAAAVSSLRVRSSQIGVLRRCVTEGGMLVVVDDIVTTGSTLAAVAVRLASMEVQVTGAAVLAATQLRRMPRGASSGLRPAVPSGRIAANRSRTRGDGRASAR